MEADGDGVDRDPKDGRGLRMGQVIPGDQPKELLVVRP